MIALVTLAVSLGIDARQRESDDRKLRVDVQWMDAGVSHVRSGAVAKESQTEAAAGVGSAGRESDENMEVVIVEALRAGVDAGRTGQTTDGVPSRASGGAKEAAVLWVADGSPMRASEPDNNGAKYADAGGVSTTVGGDVVSRLPDVSEQYGAERKGGVEQWRSLVATYFPPHEVDKALRVMQCESGGDPRAENNGSLGLMQVHYPSHAARVKFRGDLFDPETNIKVAFEIWSDQSWIPWACKP